VIDFRLVLMDSSGNSPTDTRTSINMGLGTTIRLARIFSHSSGSLFGAAIDHFVGYGDVRAGGLADLPTALAKIIAAGPDSVTMLAGTAKQLWPPYAGRASLIVQAGLFTPDDRVHELIATPEDAARLGADALAVAIPVRGSTEGTYLRWLTDSVRAAAPLEIPVVAHIYPRDAEKKIIFTPEEIAWAVRCGIETGVDVIKVGYPGDEVAFAEIIAGCPTPVVMAGGPKTATFVGALQQIVEGQRAGARGAVVGRNMWGATDVTAAALAYKAVIQDGRSAEAAAELVPAEG
jgi:class I fructose-bisphosphate aldolase